MTSERRSPRSNGSDERPLVDVAEFSRGCYRVVFSSSKTARRSRSPSRCSVGPRSQSPAMMRSGPSLIDFRRRNSIDFRRSPPSWGKTRPMAFTSAGRLLSALARGRPRSCMVCRCSSGGHTPRTGSLLRASDRSPRPNGLASVHSSESLSLCRGWCFELGGL
jgi:hypothetical protein